MDPSYDFVNSWRSIVASHLRVHIIMLDEDQRWCSAVVLNPGVESVYVGYVGFASRWDKWLTRVSGRIQPCFTRVVRSDYRRGGTFYAILDKYASTHQPSRFAYELLQSDSYRPGKWSCCNSAQYDAPCPLKLT